MSLTTTMAYVVVTITVSMNITRANVLNCIPFENLFEKKKLD